MRGSLFVAIVVVGAIAGAQSASACYSIEALDLNLVKLADIVVVGRITNYRLVPFPVDPATKERRERFFGKMPPELRKQLGYPIQDYPYAIFDIAVDEVLFGNAEQKLNVTWRYGISREIEQMSQGQYLVALQNREAPPPSPDGSNFHPNILPDRPNVLQPRCRGGFVFRADSESANAVRAILENEP